MPLTWRNVDVPRFDMRDYRSAGEGMTNAFNSLATMLHARDQRIGDEATDSRVAHMLSLDRQGLDQFIASGGALDGQAMDRRGNLREVLTAASAQRGALSNLGIADENLANLETQSRLGLLGSQLSAAEEDGDFERAMAIRQQLADQEGYGRVAMGFEGSAGQARNRQHGRAHSDRTFEEQVTQNEFTRMDANRRHALQNQRLQWEKARAEAPTRGQQLASMASEVAKQFGSAGVGRFKSSDTYRNMSLEEQEEFDTLFERASETFEESSALDNSLIGDRINTNISHLTQTADQAKAEAGSTHTQKAALSVDSFEDHDRNAALELVDNNFRLYGRTNALIDKLSGEGFTFGEISAAATYTPRSMTVRGAEGALRDTLTEMRRNPASVIQARQDQAAAPFNTQIQRLESLRKDANRIANTTGITDFSELPEDLRRAFRDSEVGAGEVMRSFSPASDPRAGLDQSIRWLNENYGGDVIGDRRQQTQQQQAEQRAREAQEARDNFLTPETSSSIPSITEIEALENNPINLLNPQNLSDSDYEVVAGILDRRASSRDMPGQSSNIARIREASSTPEDFIKNLQDAYSEQMSQARSGTNERANRRLADQTKTEMSRIVDAILENRGGPENNLLTRDPSTGGPQVNLSGYANPAGQRGQEREGATSAPNPSSAPVLSQALDKVVSREGGDVEIYTPALYTLTDSETEALVRRASNTSRARALIEGGKNGYLSNREKLELERLLNIR